MRNRAFQTAALTLLTLLYIHLFTGCACLQLSDLNNANTVEGVYMSVQNITVTRKTESLNLLITNSSVDSIGYGEQFRIEKQMKERWYILPFKPKIAFNLLARYILPGSTSAPTVDLLVLKNTLKPGEYRVVIPAFMEGKDLYLVAPFSVT